MVPAEGIEPPTFGLQNRCTTAVLSRHARREAERASSLARPVLLGNGARNALALAPQTTRGIPRPQLEVEIVRKRAWIAVGAATLLIAYLGSAAWKVAWARQNPEAARIARHERIFDQAWSTVDKHYYDPAFDHARWRQIRDVYRPRVREMPDETMLYINVLQNMMNEVGTSHVGIVTPPVERGERREPAVAPPLDKPANSPDCGGRNLPVDLGFDLVQVRRGEQVFTVAADVKRGSAAEQAGLAPGDQLLEFTSKPTPGGCQSMTVTVANPGQATRALAFQLDYGEPSPPRQRVDLPNGVRVLRFDKFDDESETWLTENLRQAPPTGLVLDLRRNSGGDIRVLSAVLGHFLPPGSSAGVQLIRGKSRDVPIRTSKVRYEGGLVVLIGPGSASAAEVAASALRHCGRALLLGAETSGQVLASRQFPLPGGGGVQVAIADFRTPDGQRLEGVGVKPNLVVLQTLDAVRAGRDLPLEAAERALLEGRSRP